MNTVNNKRVGFKILSKSEWVSSCFLLTYSPRLKAGDYGFKAMVAGR